MTDPVPEVASTEKDLDTRMATARTELKTRFMFMYKNHVKKIGLRDIIRSRDGYNVEAYRVEEEMERFKKWLEELPRGPRTENINTRKMQECFEKISAQNYDMFNMTYREDGRFRREWDRILTAVTEYRQVLTEKIATTSWASYFNWKITGQGRQVSVEHLLMQLKETA